jgi:hypothetical protein
MKPTLALLVISMLGCAAGPSALRTAPAGARASCDPARDRAAIRAMAGQFRVSFAFDEVEALAAGYALRAPYRAEAIEVVEALEASERKIVLQHVLLSVARDGSATPQKHWRQDWTFEDDQLLEFHGRGTWEPRTLAPADAACAWSQAVFEVDDGPRYESWGRWRHDGATSTWTSHETWRPLPRREYTRRSDYDVLVATNRHVVTPSGWSHEQDNVKLVLDGSRALVRERGVNRYDRAAIAQADVARRYLGDTRPFWNAVRAEWEALFARPQLVLRAVVAGEPLYRRLEPLAATAAPLDEAALRQAIRATMAPYVATTTATASAAARAR